MRGCTLFACIVLLGVTFLAEGRPEVESLESERHNLFILRDDGGHGRAQLEAAGHSWEQANGPDPDVIEVQGPPDAKEMLKSMGLELVEEHEALGSFSDEGYNTPEEIKTKIDALQTNNPSIAKVFSITSYVGASKTTGGREIFTIKLSDNVEDDEDEHNYMFVSNHHARELVTPEVALKAAEMLVQLYNADDADAKSIIDNNQVYILWTMNPDGLHNVWGGSAWQRANSRGVDLNRNYPVGWAPGHPAAYHGNCNGDSYPGETYRGASPFSEAETHMMDLWQKDRKFTKVMDVHSNGRNVRINYGCHPLPTAIHNHQAHMAAQVSAKMGYPQGQSCCMGGDIHYAYHTHGALAFLTELGGSGFQPASAGRQQVIDETWPGFFEFFKLPETSQGHIYAGSASNPGDAAPSVLKIASVPCDSANCLTDFTLGEQSETNEHGRYHLWLPAGQHSVVISPNDGSGDRYVTVTSSDTGNTQNIYLADEATSAPDSGTSVTGDSHLHDHDSTRITPLDISPDAVTLSPDGNHATGFHGGDSHYAQPSPSDEHPAAPFKGAQANMANARSYDRPQYGQSAPGSKPTPELPASEPPAGKAVPPVVRSGAAMGVVGDKPDVNQDQHPGDPPASVRPSNFADLACENHLIECEEQKRLKKL